MKAQTSIFLALLMVSSSAFAGDDLVPATSEDIAQFDRQLSNQNEQKKQSKDNFGQIVSSEAKRLKAADLKSDFGAWVSGQRRKNDQGRPDTAGGGSDRGGGGGNGGASADIQTGPGNGAGGNANGQGNGNSHGRKK